jgi:hypothetical protein
MIPLLFPFINIGLAQHVVLLFGFIVKPLGSMTLKPIQINIPPTICIISGACPTFNFLLKYRSHSI